MGYRTRGLVVSRRRFTDTDAQTFRTLIAAYGIDSVTLELWAILRQWGAQTVRFRMTARAAKRLAYAAGLAMGSAPLLMRGK